MMLSPFLGKTKPSNRSLPVCHVGQVDGEVSAAGGVLTVMGRTMACGAVISLSCRPSAIRLTEGRSVQQGQSLR
jgi:hypothetical protein